MNRWRLRYATSARAETHFALVLNRSSASVFGVSEDERSMGHPGPFNDVQ